MTLISVIMPAYNASSFIEIAIKSILNQSVKDFELLICDDASTDNTLSICNQFKKADRRVKVFSNLKNLGNLKTTNFLFEKCKGKYVTIQDADDYSVFNRFEVLLALFQINPYLGMAGSNYEVVDSNNRPLYCGLLPLKNNEIKVKMNSEVIPILYASIMIKREVLLQIENFPLFFNRKGFADLDWMARVSEITDIENSKEILYFYRSHNNSFTSSNFESSIIWRNIHYLIVFAHKNRISNKEDFFKTKNIKLIKMILSELYIKKGENFYWQNNIKMAFMMLFFSFRCCFKNVKVYKTFFYILKNIKRNV